MEDSRQPLLIPQPSRGVVVLGEGLISVLSTF